MKTSDIYRIYASIIVLSLLTTISHAQADMSFEEDQYYLVVGAFRIKNNAVRFAEAVQDKNHEAIYKYNENRGLNYVYTFMTDDKEIAIDSLYNIREKHADMHDAWLYYKNSEDLSIATSTQSPDPESPEEPVTRSIPTSGDEEEAAVTTATIEEETTETVATQPAEAVKETPRVVKEPGGFLVYLNTVDAKNHKEVSGKFKIIDMERNREHSTVDTQQLLSVKPKNGTNRVKFISDIFGYRLDEHVIDLDNPLENANSRIEIIGDTIMIDFELARYQKGDFAVLWKVYFYKDAAIMKQESSYELNQLLKMMQSDDKMRIKIHGHTNGNSYGKVLHLNLEDKEFFSINSSHHEDNASAKKLSEFRAYTIQHWLIDQGIAEDRMEIVGWGGKKMLYDKHDDNAHQNVRVEIEVLDAS